MDDEYRFAGCEDPKIVVTTSRNPSAKLKMFAKVCDGAKTFRGFFRRLNLRFPNRSGSTEADTTLRA